MVEYSARLRGPMRLSWILTLILLLSGQCYGAEARRSKRSIREFGTMIKLLTGRSGLDFNGYGNYCGMGGSGIPLDPIDECCMHHDRCYDQVNLHDCAAEPSFVRMKPYTARYRWFMENDHFECVDLDICKRRSCMCDSMAARCFAMNAAFYDGRKRTILGRMFSSLLG
ncbi:acidic phospholipase A2 Cc1-PLA2-like isoform X1 [Argopecten irradians]|uniref:acidic phospholipase A2 Cc1-PLA2-like isoform X1 n=2 Tax=Argopecten irradians TaxID=31199 RepID=UPI00370FF774